MSEFLNPQSEVFQTYFVPLLICLARIVDVTLGTIRSLLANKGRESLPLKEAAAS